VFVRISQKQGMALDRIARKLDVGDGMDLLMRLTGKNRSYIGKMDYPTIRPHLDDAFNLDEMDRGQARKRLGFEDTAPPVSTDPVPVDPK
jgi:hypothetical protein